MAFSMVNSGTFGPEGNENTKVSYMQTNSLHINTASPLTASSATHSVCKNDVEAMDSGQLYKAVEPIPSETKYNDFKGAGDDNNLKSRHQKLETSEAKRSLFCSFPLEKVQTILSKYTPLRSDSTKMKAPRKVLCLYCDRTFVNVNLRLKHVERCHSSKQLRRVSLRKHQNFLTSTPCIYCDKFTSTEHTLKDLLKHLIENHSNKYFGCLPCELRFLNSSHQADHNALCHNIITTSPDTTDPHDVISANSENKQEELPTKVQRKKLRTRKEAKTVGSNVEESSKPGIVKNLRSKKISVKSSRMILKRSKRIQAKVTEVPKRKRTKDLNEKKKKHDRLDQNVTKLNEKSTKTTSGFVNPYPEFDHFFQVKKITDHSIDNLKISSLTFDDVFDKAFFNKIKCNIQENLLHHIDGKLFKNEESENRISNFEKISDIPQETQNLHSENYGCELSLNAIAPTTLLLSNQLGDDPESQIEYGSKPSKKKTQMKKDEVHYKYFTRRKYQASILEHKENRDLSKLDMWTQYVIKNRQQKIIDDKKSPKEILDYFAGEEYKSTMKREELNRILDRRGPFEDLREEVSKKAALDKLNCQNSTNDDHSTEIAELLNDILNRVFELVKEPSRPPKNVAQHNEENIPELPSYLNLRSSKSVIPENEIDRSDKIALICSSQETENFELPSNTVREKNEKVELTGEWARSRIYVCAACGLKLQNLKQFLEHKSAAHQYIWVQHYEFVGNQSELYRHLSIPTLGKVGVLENTVQCKVWKRSDARLCTKCGKQCNSLGELHRHILECGGDWTWMLARKKCKYRPFGAKSRRKRRGLVKRIYTQKTEPSEKKVYKKLDVPRQKPSDADTIKRMLANLPAKRATRKLISLKDGFNTRTRKVQTTQQAKFKCGKLIRGKAKETKTVAKTEYEKNKKQTGNYRRSLRCLNKVLTSRILDTNSSLMVKRKISKKINRKQKKKQNFQTDNNQNSGSVQDQEGCPVKVKKNSKNTVLQEDNQKVEPQPKRSSPRIEKRSEFTTGPDKMNIKRFFPVKKKKKANSTEKLKIVQLAENESTENKLDEDLGPPPLIYEGKVDTIKPEVTVNSRKRKNEKNPRSRKKSKLTKNATKVSRTLRHKLSSETDSLAADFPKLGENFCETEVKETENVTNLEISQIIENKDEGFFGENAKEEQNDTHVVKSYPNIEEVKVENVNPILPLSTGSTAQQKKKIRKPARGLNDCIAMLTSKLVKNFEDVTTHGIFNEEVRSEERQKTELILKVPFSNEHFDLRQHQDIEKQVNTGSGVESVEIIDAFIPDIPVFSVDCKSVSDRSFNLFELEKDVEQQNEDIMNQEEIPEKDLSPSTDTEEVISDTSKPRHDTDSEDEIPLSTLLRGESPLIQPNTDKSDEFDSEVPQKNDLLMNEEEVKKVVETHIEENKNLCDVETKLTKKKDVLMEINDNFYEPTEHQNSASIFETNSNKAEKVLENKIDDSHLVASNLTLNSGITLDKANDVDATSLETQSISMLNKFNFFTKDNVNDVVWKNAVIDDEPVLPTEAQKEDRKNESDVSEYKENSVLLVVEETVAKHKPKKKSSKSSNKTKGASQNKNEDKIINNKKSRIMKSKRIEAMIDDVLLELSENELPDNSKETTEESASVDKKEEMLEFYELEEKRPEIKEFEKDISKVLDSTDNSIIKEGEDLNDSIQDQENSISNEDKTDTRELRRSSRNSKRITYNETDLLDPLLDDIENDRTISKIIKETTKDIFGNGKRKNRKMSQKKKNGETERKLNGDELFDLLKSPANENIVLSKPTTTFFNTFDDISNEFNDDNFDVLGDILEKSIAVIEENLSEQAALISSEVATESFDQSTEHNFINTDSVSKSSTENKKSKKKKTRKHKNISSDKNSQIDIKDTEFLLGAESVDTNDEITEINQPRVKPKVIYCEICNKSFSRTESLTKHKRTLTHISKLSELEAKEAAMKTKSPEIPEELETSHLSVNSTKELNLLDMLGNMTNGECKQFSSPFTVNVNNSNLKLADIINDVLNKPMLKKDDTQSFDEIIMPEAQPEIRRCKSLAERKSFESETKHESHVNNVDYLESDISNAAAGTILEKQITLLENIIENRNSLGFMEELSISSSVNENVDEKEDEIDPKQAETQANVYIKENNTIEQHSENFLKPSQYEEISDDSSLRNYDEQKSRKALNRDEELFLECCSLLKSGSEVSSYSKKSNNLTTNLNKLELKRGDEPDWLVAQKENCDFVECYSDSSRIRTPLGDNFSQEESNSATIASQWDINHCTSSKKGDWKEDSSLQKNLTFEKVFSSQKNEEIFCERNEMEELHTVVSSFDRVISEVLHTELDTSSKNMKKDSHIDLEQISTSLQGNDDFQNSVGVVDGRKMLTKGAMKVFEGLKVSIPTEELNMDKLLVSKGVMKTFETEEICPKPVKLPKSNKRSQTQSKNAKLVKPKHIPKLSNLKKLDIQINSKNHDVYDFEETQDNSDIFTKPPDFRTYRNCNEKGRKNDKIEGSDEDSQDYTDTFGFDAQSSSASSVSEVLPTRSETEQNITKKKCMIMGRIFKNAVKSKSTDEDIRSIPIIDNTKLVENFVLSCPVAVEDKKPRMTEEEMNLAFDKLINNKSNESVEARTKTSSPQLQSKIGLPKRKQKIRTKKRTHANSESSDDEFKLQKYSKKRHKKKSNNDSEESCINLEQELRECIGVASRKSQRKCTSGKQNVLIEYWSSDESSFETLLEKQIIESVKKNNTTSSTPKNNIVQEVRCTDTEILVENFVVHEMKEPEVTQKKTKVANSNVNRRKRVAANPLYHWSSSSEDESRDLIEVRPVRDEIEDDEDRPVQHGWIVGDSPKKLVTMLAQAKGKKCEVDGVKEHGRRKTSS